MAKLLWERPAREHFRLDKDNLTLHVMRTRPQIIHKQVIRCGYILIKLYSQKPAIADFGWQVVAKSRAVD